MLDCILILVLDLEKPGRMDYFSANFFELCMCSEFRGDLVKGMAEFLMEILFKINVRLAKNGYVDFSYFLVEFLKIFSGPQIYFLNEGSRKLIRLLNICFHTKIDNFFPKLRFLFTMLPTFHEKMSNILYNF